MARSLASGKIFCVQESDPRKKNRMMRAREKVRCLVVLLLAATPSCTVGPDYEAPEITVPDGWTASIQQDLGSSISGSQHWWRKFGDQDLNRLIARARKASPNIRIAQKRIDQAWYQRGVLSAAFYPHVDFSSRDDYGLGGFSTSGVRIDPFESHGNLTKLDYGWELDVFGRIKRQTEAAEAEWQARYEGYRDTQVFITAEVALDYIAMRALEGRLQVARDSTASFKRIYELIQIRHEEGISAKVEVKEAEARYRATEADVPRLQKELAVVRNKLASLLAIHPSQLNGFVNEGEIPEPPRSIAVGFPLELLRSRPDVRRAERRIANQTALVGVATADLYPSLSISGAIRYEILERGSVIELLERVIGIGGNFRQRIYHACADQYRIAEQNEKLKEAIIFYEKTIIEAVTNVEDAMSSLNYESKRLELLEKASASHQETADLLFESYKSGLIDIRRLLNGYRDAAITDDERLATEGRRAAHAVRLFKALGGGELAAPDKFPVGSQNRLLPKKRFRKQVPAAPEVR